MRDASTRDLLPTAGPRPKKKKRQEAPGQPAEQRVLPTQLRIGDRMTDSTGEWEVVGRPYTTAGGRNAHVRVQRVSSSASLR
jgi:hypothetical protein